MLIGCQAHTLIYLAGKCHFQTFHRKTYFCSNVEYSVGMCSESCCDDHFPGLLCWPFCAFSLVPLFLFIRCLLCFPGQCGLFPCGLLPQHFLIWPGHGRHKLPWSFSCLFWTTDFIVLAPCAVVTALHRLQGSSSCFTALALGGQQCLKFWLNKCSVGFWLNLQVVLGVFQIDGLCSLHLQPVLPLKKAL